MNYKIVLLFSFLFLPILSFGHGFDEHYEVRYGDFDSDGVQDDLYIRHRPPIVILDGEVMTPVLIPSDGDVQEFVLKRISNGTYVIDSSLSSTEKDMVSQWSKAAIELVVSDFNIDGELDILLKGVSSIIGGAFDQIVFAASTAGQAPQAVTAVDTEFQQFFAEVYNWMLNPNYFEENAPTTTQPITVNDTIFAAEWCATPAWVAQYGPLSNLPPFTLVGNTLEDIIDERADFAVWCVLSGLTELHYDFISVQYQVPAGGLDYSGFSQEALGFRNAGAMQDPDFNGNQKYRWYWVLAEVLGQILIDEAVAAMEDIISAPDDIGIENDYKGHVLVAVLRTLCAIKSDDECIIVVEEIMDEWLESHELDHDKADLEAVARWVGAFAKAEEKRRNDSAKLHCTYRKLEVNGVRVYFGRASGNFPTCAQVVAARDSGHHKNPFFGTAVPFPNAVGATGPLGYAAISGREQQLIDSLVYDNAFPLWTAESHGLDLPSKIGNERRGVAKRNTRGCDYWESSTIAFGEIGPYTGFRFSTCQTLNIKKFPDEYQQ